MSRPPLVPIGIMPRYIWEIKRAEELKAAIERYTAAGCVVPIKWVEEYNDFIRKWETK